MRKVVATLGFVAALMVLPTAATAQTNGTWTNTSGGTWNTTGNWSGGFVASGTGALADFSTLNISGTQTVTLDAAYTLGSLSFADTTTSSSGSWVIGNGGTIGNTLTLNAGSGTTPKITVSGMGSGNATISARVLGTSGFILNDTNTPNPGTLVLSGSNSFSGNVTVNSGTLAFQNTGTNGFAYSGSSGILQLNAAGLSISTGVGTTFQRAIVLGAGTSTIVNQGTALNEITGVISGVGALYLGSSSGGIGLASTYTYSGGVVVGPGANLVLRGGGAGTPNNPTSGVFGTGTVTLAGGQMRPYSTTTGTIHNVVNVTADTTFGSGGNPNINTIWTGSMTLSGSRTFTVDQTLVTFNGSIGDGGLGYGLTKAGAATLILGASNAYTGNTTLNSGTLRLDNQNALVNSTLAMSGTGSLLFSSTVVANAFTFGGLSASSTAATLTLSNTAGTAITLTVGGNNASTSYAGSLTGGGSLVKTGAGTLTLSGSNTYSGNTSVTQGSLTVSSSAALPGFDTNGRFSIASGATLAVTNGVTDAAVAAILGTNNLASGAVFGFDTSAGDRAYGSGIGGGIGLVKRGANTLTLSSSNGFTGTTTLTGGTLALGDANALAGGGNVTFSGGVLRYTASSQADLAGRIASSGSAVLIDTNGQSVSWSGNLAASNLAGLNKLGSGTLTLSGSNAYGGTTTLSGGALALGSANALPGSGTITFSGGTLQYTAGNTTDYTAQIASSGSAVAIDTNGWSVTFTGGIGSTNTGGLTKLGAGTLTLSGSSGYSGATTVAGGVLALGNANSLPGSGNITFTGGTMQYSASNTTDFASRIVSSTSAVAIDTNNQSVTFAGNLVTGNSGGLTKLGAGTLTLSGSNTFTGAITVSAGTLGLSSVRAIPSSGVTIVLDGGVLNRSGTAQGTLTAAMSIGAAGGEIRAGTTGQWGISSTISGGAGTGALVLNSSSAELIINGSNSYAGGTRILAGNGIAVSTDSALGSGTMSFEGGSLRTTSTAPRILANPVSFVGDATFDTAQKDLTFNGAATIAGSSRTITVSSTTSLATYAGSIGDGGNSLGFTKAGVGTLILGGSNTYSGTTTLNAGTVRLDNADAFAGGGNLSFTGGTLQYSSSNTTDYASRIRSSSSPIRVDTNSQTVTWNNAVDSTNVGGLAKSGSGTLVLAGANAYSGNTTVSGGTLQIGNGGTTGSILGNITLSNTSGLVFNRSNDLTYSGAISGTGSLTKSGAGSLTLSGAGGLASGAAITINGGALVLSDASTLNNSAVSFAYTIDGGTLAMAATAPSSGFKIASLSIGAGGATYRSDTRADNSGVISGASPTASLTYGTTSGTASGVIMVIGGSNTYAGGTKLESGVWLYVDNNSAFGTGALDLSGGAIRSREASNLPRSLANAVTISANTQFNGPASGPNLTFTGTTLLSGGTRTLQVDNVLTSGTSVGQPGVIFTNVIGDGGNAFGITKTGTGVLGLAGANTYSGATTLNAGTIQLQNQAALQNSTLSLSGTGGVVFDSAVAGNAFTLGGLSASSNAATLALQNSAATAIALTVGGNNANTTYAGSLTGSGSLEKVGTGSLVLSGPNTFAGTATVTSGTLQVGNGTTGGLTANIVNNAALVFGRSNSATYSGNISGSGAVTTSGAGTLTLSGSNSYAGPTTLAGGTLALGSASALPASGTVTFTGGALQYSSSYTADLSSRIAGSTGAVVIDTNGQSRTWASSLDGSNVGGLTKLGSGTLTLSVANALTGPVTVGGGVLAAGNAAALPASGNVTFTSGTLQYSSSYTADLSARIVGSSAAISIDTNNQSRTWSSSLASTNVGGLTKSGVGTLTLSASNAYSGVTTVSAGNLLVNHAAALGSGTSVSVSTNGASLTIGNGITAGAGKTVTVNSNGSGNGNSDGGLNVLAGTGTWAGDVIINTGIGRLGYNTGNLVVTGSVGGTSFTVSGYGGDTNTNVAGYAVTLAGPTGYSGNTNILRGWLKIGADNTLPVGTTLDVFTVANTPSAAQAATFDLNGFNQTIAGLTSSGNNGKTGYANGYVTNTGASVKTLTVNQTTTGTYGGLITGNLAFTKTGAGNLTLMPIFVTGSGNAFVSGTNTFTGDTLVSGGTLTLSTATGNTSLALAGSTFDSNGAGTLSFGSMTAATFGGLKGAGTLALQNGSSQAVALTVGANGGSMTYSGGLSGAGSLIKAGAGTLTLSGSSTNAGATTVSAGSLVVDGSLASAVSLAGSTSLGGRGSVGAISGAGLVGPGNSPGILTATSVDPSGGLSFAFEFTQANPDYANAAASNNDVLSISSLSPFASSLTSTNVVSIYLTPSVVELGTFTGGFFTSSLQSDFLSSISSATYQYFVQDAAGSFSYNGQVYKSLAQYDSSKSVTVSTVAANGGQVMQMVVVPEPAALALAGIGAALAGWHLVRRSRRSA